MLIQDIAATARNHHRHGSATPCVKRIGRISPRRASLTGYEYLRRERELVTAALPPLTASMRIAKQVRWEPERDRDSHLLARHRQPRAQVGQPGDAAHRDDRAARSADNRCCSRHRRDGLRQR
jgi:hypothetical protein